MSIALATGNYCTDAPLEVPASSRSAAQAAIRTERDIAIRRALDALPPAQRMAVVLRYYEANAFEDALGRVA